MNTRTGITINPIGRDVGSRQQIGAFKLLMSISGWMGFKRQQLIIQKKQNLLLLWWKEHVNVN